MEAMMIVITVLSNQYDVAFVPLASLEICRKNAPIHVGTNEEKTLIRTTACLSSKDAMEVMNNWTKNDKKSRN